MRLFFAFSLPSDVRRELASVQTGIASTLGSGGIVRWVPEDDLHATIHFLGEVGEGHVDALREAGAEIAARFRPASAALDGVSWFPEGGEPRVITVLFHEERGATLVALREELAAHLERMGIDVDRRPWTPHVTIGRVRSRIDRERLVATCRGDRFEIGSFALIQSALREDGAVYTTIGQFPLAA